MRKRVWSAAVLLAALSTSGTAYAQQEGKGLQDETEPALHQNGPTRAAEQERDEKTQRQRSAQSGAQARTADEESAKGGSLSARDREFLTKAAQGSLAEIQMGKLAQEQGSSDEVQDIGETLVEDHSDAHEDVQKLASDKQIVLPSEPSEEQQAAVARMAKLTGQEFDREFLREQAKDHEKDIAAFERAQRQSEDSDVQQFASDTLPVLREHLELIQEAMGSDAQTEPARRPARTSDR